MKLITALILSVTALTAQAETKIPSGAGDKGTYFIMSNQVIQGRNLVVSRRAGPSGTSFAAREINCQNETFRYVAEGDTVEDMKKNVTIRVQDMSMAPITYGSASYYVVKAACK
jgi:hypothetical protein